LQLPDILVMAVNVLVVFGFIMNIGALLTWVERKQSAVMQDRVGANRAYLALPFSKKKFTLLGLTHIVTDSVKMLTKENFMPRALDPLVYNLAPFFAVVPTLLVFSVIPLSSPFSPGTIFDVWYLSFLPASFFEWLRNFFGDTVYRFQVADLNVGILLVFAVGSFSIFGSVLAGWSSNNKFSLMGAMRAASQMISYEVSMGLSITGIIFIFGTLDPQALIAGQSEMLFGIIPKWGIFLQPVAFILFFTAQIAESKRVPFDLPECESEIVAGYFTEYSAMKMALFMLGEFVGLVVIAGVTTLFFFGGYHLPFLVDDGFHFAGTVIPLAPLSVFLLRHLAFVAKVLLLIFVQMLIRWTLPRFRYDQLMHLGWKILLPLSLANLVVTALVTL
jgi:NADH-quinone oxidoreductase subunit H